MKKLFAAVLAVALLAYTSAASATPGGKDDPFVSKNYIDGTFSQEVQTEIGKAAESKFNTVYESAVGKLTEKISGISYEYSEEYVKISVPGGKMLRVTTGGSAVLLSGNALNKLTGAVIDVTDGAAVSVGSSIVKGHRYFSAENTVSGYAAESVCVFYVKGYYSVTDVNSVPSGREFTEATFSDVKKTDWYYAAVGYGYTNYLINGASDTEFMPLESVTRGQFVTFLFRMSGEKNSKTTSDFTDVADNEYYTPAIVWATECGVVGGYGDGTFGPDDEISREQMATMMYRYAAHKGISLISSDSGRINSFPDAKDISGYAVYAMTWAVGNGLINGSDGELLPTSTAQRAQAAQIIYNLATFLKQ